MPNWCQNTLLMQGNVDEVQRLLDVVKASDTTLSLRNILTTPEPLVNATAPNRDQGSSEEFVKLYGAADWYDWQVSNWGTKWDVEATIYFDSSTQTHGYSTHRDKEIRTVGMNFDSAWSPPTRAIAELARQFPNISIYHSYDESGCDFSGYNMYRNGACVDEKEFPSLSHIRMYIEPENEIFDYFPQQ
jgi:Ferredoxin-like domain in Api92-like protein